ncbi:MAG: hypothetical protein DI537_39215 [Stutzerimonas stutzeri]|nr:MAG: hypothetical protein DI537_39215 [Stutzerimonas stutzeri]
MFHENAMTKAPAENPGHADQAQCQPRESFSSQVAPHRQPRRRMRIPAWPALIILSIGCFKLGHLHATLQTLHNDRRNLIWALLSEGERARRLSNSGILQVVEACAAPSQFKISTCCSALPGLITGETWVFCASPIR